MKKKGILSFVLGIIFLFCLYHFPEFYSSFLIMAVFKISFLFFAYILAILQGWKGLGGFGLKLNGKWIFNLLNGLCIGLAGFAVSVWLSALLGFERIILIESSRVIIKQVPMLLLSTCIPSMAEDILTRGYLLGHLSKKLQKTTWVLLSAGFFVLNHIWRLNDGMAVLLYLFLLGLLLAYSVWQTKALWLAFGIHWGSNIAFASTNAFIKTESLVTHNGDTLILALIWGILFCLFYFFLKPANKTLIT